MNKRMTKRVRVLATAVRPKHPRWAARWMRRHFRVVKPAFVPAKNRRRVWGKLTRDGHFDMPMKPPYAHN